MTVGPDGRSHELDAALRAVGQRLDGARVGRMRFVAGKVRRHVDWARTEGVRRLIEEDRLDPVDRARTAWNKRQWQRRHGRPPGTGRTVFVVGLQRSGTNMLLRGIDRSPDIEVHNENDRAVFERYRLRDDAVVAETVGRSRAASVLFKPLCDSHRAVELLAMPGLAAAPRAVWVYRNVDGRVRSAIAKFGDHDRTVLQAIVGGQGEHLWQAGGLTADVRTTLASFPMDELTAESASALFWWARNSLVFDLGLAGSPDVALLSYDRIIADPVPEMARLAAFLDIRYSPALVADIDPRARREHAPLDLEPRVRALCDEMQERLDGAAVASSMTRHHPASPDGLPRPRG